VQPGKILFVPVGIAGGLVGGLVGKKLFDLAWSRISNEEVPAPDQREAPWAGLAAALALEGAIFRTTRGLVDHGIRVGFLRATGTWPGEEGPDPTE
jgi:hypothetical protein